MLLPMNTTLTTFIPPQLDPSSADLVEAIADASEAASTTIIGTSFILNLIIMASLNHFWSLMNSLQITTHVPLMHLKFPANVNRFMLFYIEIACFEFIKMDDAYVYAFNLP